jgi:hypothetical protein
VASRSRNTSRIFRIDNLSPGILDPLLLGKEPNLPTVEDCQWLAIWPPNPNAIVITATMIKIH